jgi:hypothetical protein
MHTVRMHMFSLNLQRELNHCPNPTISTLIHTELMHIFSLDLKQQFYH